MIPYYRFDQLSLGPIHLHVFGTLLVLGIITAHSLLVRRARAMNLGSPAVIEGFAVSLGAGALVLGFVVERLLGLGLSSAAGALGALLVGLGYALIFRLDLLRLADALAWAVPPGWLVARLGCAAAHDHLSGPSTSIFAIRFPDGPKLDLGLCEVLLLPLAIGAAHLAGQSRRQGAMAGAAALGYALLRFPLDFLRESDIRFGGLTLAQWGCAALLIAGAVVAVISTRRAPDGGEP
ncbi:MAG: prolipoprotein diacylglyceryl transferase family protein [Byssovorax sp.]